MSFQFADSSLRKIKRYGAIKAFVDDTKIFTTERAYISRTINLTLHHVTLGVGLPYKDATFNATIYRVAIKLYIKRMI